MSVRDWREVKEELEQMKASANETFRGGNILRAVEIYKEIIDALLKRQNEDLDGDVSDKGERDRLLMSVYMNLAFCSRKNREFTACIHHCSKALALDGTNSKALYRRGEALQANGNYALAVKDFQNLLVEDPENQLFDESAVRCLETLENPEIIGESQVPKVSYHASFAYKDKMLMWGGIENDIFFDKTYFFIYWPLTNLWFRYKTKDAPLKLKLGFASVSFQSKLAIFGGIYDIKNKMASEDLYILDLDTLIWSKMKPSGIRSNHSRGWYYKGKLWFYGGDLLDVLCFDLEKETWSKPECKGRIPQPRFGHTITDLENGSVLLFGGAGLNRTFFNDVHIFKMDALTWTSIEPRSFIIPRSLD